ncbi:restriction endonuclease subunit S [Virgibacillus ihumii]|uniref:restriction endonuclease subunit S n=1 Tax=Virgibacillus ihumii TaxID=2686091 RepID=UPI00157D2D59|nr:restriction endonuclease subunit S [Virgibacillus ihumii]
MNRKLKPYPEYKDSGVKWIGKIPPEWNYLKLKRIVSVELSNIDKKSRENEIEISLCNYTDVYYNNTITSELNFMKATAKQSQIDKFKLRKDNVLITKDSETPNDIGVPTWVSADLENVICGYHLAQIRPSKKIMGKYLFYMLASTTLNEQLHSLANGVTRYGISKTDIENSLFLAPKLEIQRTIINFLDQKTSEIDALIADKEKYISLLEEKRQAVITETVTKGLDPNVKMKDSGIEWIGEVPENWVKSKLKFISNQIIDGAHSTPTYIDEGIPFLRVTDLTKSKGEDLLKGDVKYIPLEEHSQLIKRCKPEKGDLLLSKNGTIGIPRVVDWDFDFSIFVSLCLIKFKKEKINPYYCSYFFESNLVDQQIAFGGKKSTIVNLHLDKIKEFLIFLPPIDEQDLIVNFLGNKAKKYDDLINDMKKQISKFKEYRESLIFEAVTGKIDLRDYGEETKSLVAERGEAYGD